MLTEQNEEELLEKAELAEKECDWSKALKLYEQVANSYLNKKKIEEAAQTYMKLANAYMFFVRTVNTAEEMIRYEKLIIKHFATAEMFFNQSNNNEGAMECKLGQYQNKLWTATSLLELNEVAEKALELVMHLIDFYRKQGEKENLARNLTNSDDIISSLLASSTSFEEYYKLSQKGIKFANEALKISKELGNIKLISRSLSFCLGMQTALIQVIEFRGVPEFRNTFKGLLVESENALKLIENKKEYIPSAIFNRISGVDNYFFAFHYIEDERKQQEYFKKGLNQLKNTLEIGRKIQDKLIIFSSTFWLDWWALFSGNLEYLQKRMARDISEIEEVGINFSRIFRYSSGYTRIITVYYASMARLNFFSIKQRKTYAELGIQYGEKHLENFPPGSPTPLTYIEIFEILVTLYSQLALLTDNTEQQELYLKKMLGYADRTYALGEQAKGGFWRASLYLTKYNAYKTLSDVAQNEKDKIKFLTIAVEASKKHIVHTIESRTGIITAQLRLGLLLEELGILSENFGVLKDAKDIFNKVINDCVYRGYKSYAANAYHYLARIEDRLGNHMSSAKNYQQAEQIYKEALQNIEFKPLINRITEKMLYSSAWNLIENAKVNHKSENHIQAKEFYINASNTLKEIDRYTYEASYYKAWGLLEEAEHVSKQEQQEKAIEIYEMTIKAFEEAIKNLEKTYNQSKAKNELTRIDKLMKVANIRINYCSARINLESARILGRKGEHTTAAELFATAASKFRGVCMRFKLERERKELEAIYFLCRAWESMELAEKYEEHTRFAEAAKLFTRASNLFSDSKLKFLSSANSAFCQSLELGCKFDETFNTEVKEQLYPKVKVMLSQAASLYGKGGFESGADWAQATSIYFDAAWQLIKADEETDLNKKGNLLKIGSEYLKSALELFGKAGYKEKEKEVRDRLNRVEKEETTLFSALSTLQEPSISRSTIGIVAPTCPIETSESPRLGEVRQMSEELNQASSKIEKEKEFRPTVSVEEQPVVLLIIAEGGVPIFSYPFAEEWKFDDELFGGFLTSFSSISDEIFSEGLDRAKFGQYTVLIESIEDFSICYLFKGQIYSAKEKLMVFIDRIRNNASIMKTLNTFKKASQVIELDDIPILETLLTEIFLT